jgi:cytochrome c oxidase subunit 2
MRHRRVFVQALLGLGLLALFTEPVAAQTTINDELITGLNERLLYVAIPISILVEVILIYTVVRYRASNVDEAKPTQENRRLEITWTVATAVILLFVGFASYQVLGVTAIGGVTAASNPNAQPAAVQESFDGAIGPEADEENAVQIEVVAQKYFWEYKYDNGSVVGTSTADEPLYIPKDRPVYLHITSTDWLHAFHVPDMGLKQDAFPGQYNTIKTVAYEEGAYQLYCAEYCGVGHAGMLGKVQVVSNEEYQGYLEDKRAEDSESSGNSTNATSANSTESAMNATSANATSANGTNATSLAA